MSEAKITPLGLKKPSSRVVSGLTIKEEGEWKGDFCFIQAADTQLGLYERYIEKKPLDQIKWDWEIKLCQATIKQINKMSPKPRFMIVCGDIIDAMPEDPNRPKQLHDIFKVFSELCPDIPLVCLCGNHDIGDSPTPKDVSLYREEFGDDYYDFWVGGVRCLVLNSQFFSDPSNCMELAKEQDQWLDAQLKSPDNANAKHIIIFQHIPWFLDQSDEEDSYFNVPQSVRHSWLKKFVTAGVRVIFCGHYHRNAAGWYDNIEHVVTSAVGMPLGVDANGYRVVKVTEDRISHVYTVLEDPPKI